MLNTDRSVPRPWKHFFLSLVVASGLLSLCVMTVAVANEAAAPLEVGGSAGTVAEIDGAFSAAILLDVNSGMILAAKNPDQQRQPASMLKMMTELIVLEFVADGEIAFDDTVTVSARASLMGGSQVYLKHGERFTVEELLEALAIHSANDAAVSLAEHTAGSVEAFIDLMNDRAARLGMSGSEFHSVHGLPAGRGQSPDLTTPRDMATMARALLEHPEVLMWSNQATAPFRGGKFIMYNPNKLVGRYRGLDGLKTGYHGRAGYCVTATAVQKGVRLVSVVMNCPTDRSRATETTRILSYGFNLYHQLTLVESAGLAADGAVAVQGGKAAEISVVYADALQVSVPRDLDERVTLHREVTSPLQAPVAKGEKVGVAVATLDGYELGRVDLLAAETVEKGNWFHRLFH